MKRVKQALSTAPLQYFDTNRPTILQCDASQYDLGAVLLQENGPIAYASRKLRATE